MGFHPHLTVIRSKLPEKDAATLLRLLPSFNELEKTKDTVVLFAEANEAVSRAKSNATPSQLLLMFVRAQERIDVVTPLVATEKQIESAQELCNGKKDVSLNFMKTVTISGGECPLCSITLQGGPTILLSTPALTLSEEGRVVLAKALLSRTIVGDAPKRRQEDMVTVPLQENENESLANGGAIMKEAMSPPKIPSLKVSLLNKDGTFDADFPVNSPEPIPVETDLFVGKMLMVIRPINPEDDPYWNERLFSKKKRRVVFQLQGKFKRVPKGTVYAGGEISNQMRLGLVAKGVCGILLKLIKSFSSDVHYSFGDSKDAEKPHIVIPAWSFFERLVVTKPDKVPPTLGEEFVETRESIAARKSFKTSPNWNTQDTYSMSFYSMYMDFAKWQVVQLPVSSDIDLKTFWGNSSLKIVLYENTTPAKEDKHLQVDNNYFFAIQMKFLGLAPRKDSESEEEPMLPWETRRSISNGRALSEDNRRDSRASLVDDEEEQYFFDANEEASMHEVDSDTSVGVEDRSESIASLNLLMAIDSVCPTMIEMCHRGKYAKVYAFNLRKKGVTVFRTASALEEYFGTSKVKDMADKLWSPRLSSSERCRRILGQTVSQALVDQNTRPSTMLNQFTNLRTEYDKEFLRREEPSWAAKRRPYVRKSGYCARALSDRHWQEEWIQVTDRYILFNHPDKQKPHFRICLQSIVEAKCMPPDDMPLMPSYSFAAIGTLGRTIYLMFSSQVECTDWIDLTTGLIAMRNAFTGSIDTGSVSSDHSMALDDPADEFLHKSSMWHCKQRRILNCRKFSFRAQDAQRNDPARLVEDALVRALEQGDDDEWSMIAFLDSAAALKDVDVYQLGESERLSFFLNLYHIMIMHAFLVLGPPDSTFKWISYFNMISYQCSDDVFSLTELEHCIIRAAMNYPSQFVSKFVLPKSQYRFALSKADFRINFALNCGSTSNPPVVPIYKAKILDRQLDAATKLYLNYAVEVYPSSKRGAVVTLSLPTIMKWFADDFGESTNELVQCIESFLNADQRKLLSKCYSDREKRYDFGDLNVKYLSYSFDCRYLMLKE